MEAQTRISAVEPLSGVKVDSSTEQHRLKRSTAEPGRPRVLNWLLGTTMGTILTTIPIAAQPSGEEMLLRELAGHRYERISYDPRGSAEGRILIEVGELRRVDSAVEVPVTVTPYSDDGAPQESNETVWRCRQGQEHMIMPVLFLSEDSGAEVGLEVEGDAIFYPEFPPPRELPDLRLDIGIRKGFVSFLGGRTVVFLKDRRVRTSDEASPESHYTVFSNVDVKVFVVGIRVKHLRFNSEVVVQSGKGLVHQTLTAADGSYSVLRSLPGDDARAPTAREGGFHDS